MSIKTNKILCVERLCEMSAFMDELTTFLIGESLMNAGQAKELRSSNTKGKDVVNFLQDLSTKEKLQLLEYDWKILPVEYIRIIIVTDKAKHEFTWGG